MELLTIEHEDFTMIVECTKFDNIWDKAKSNVGEDKLYSTYSWSEGVVSVKRTLDADHEIDIEQGVPAPATFFDNADYPIWIEFKDYVKDAQFGSILQNVVTSWLVSSTTRMRSDEARYRLYIR